MTELLDAAELDETEDAKARFAATFILDALAPTNTLLGNPAALREAFDTGGESLLRGAKNMMDDIKNNGGWPSQVDSSDFEVGVNMAATPGAVIYRNELIELIQYAPQTEQVFEVPLLFCPPWINKYYIMDLAPGKSLIEWAVQHGHTCFAISYRNPDASLRDLGLEDYLRKGLFDAVRVIREITGAPEVNTVSLCLGGTLSAIGLAYNAAKGDSSIKSATFLNTNTDFSVPGALGIFTDESTIAGLEEQMAKDGYAWGAARQRPGLPVRRQQLAAGQAAARLRPARVEWRQHPHAGQDALAVPEVLLPQQRIRARGVRDRRHQARPQEGHGRHLRGVGGQRPHRAVGLGLQDRPDVLGPPSPKAKFWSNDERPVDPLDWKHAAKLIDDTWWHDWAEWIGAEGGAQVGAPAKPGDKKHPSLEAAPGSYVLDRA